MELIRSNGPLSGSGGLENEDEMTTRKQFTSTSEDQVRNLIGQDIRKVGRQHTDFPGSVYNFPLEVIKK